MIPFLSASPNAEWVLWWLFIFGSFTVLEARAFAHPERANTLSRFMATVGAKFPLSIGMIGMVLGGLMVHFFWHWGCGITPGVG